MPSGRRAGRRGAPGPLQGHGRAPRHRRRLQRRPLRLFTVRGQMEAVLCSETGVPLTVGQQVIAGAGAGDAVSFLACPTELIKCSFPIEKRHHVRHVRGDQAGHRRRAGHVAARPGLDDRGGRARRRLLPTDVVKRSSYKNPKYSGSMDAFRNILAADGVKGLYKGFGPAMARSVPANAAFFLAYEMTRSALG